MIIKATLTIPGMLDLSSQERLQEENSQEAKPFRLTLRPKESVEVDDQWYVLKSIQNAIKRGWIEILDYKQQHVFIQEVSNVESYTNNYNFTKVEILNRADYPQDAFRKYNENFDKISSSLNGVRIFVSAIPPSNPLLNDIWIDIS